MEHRHSLPRLPVLSWGCSSRHPFLTALSLLLSIKIKGNLRALWTHTTEVMPVRMRCSLPRLSVNIIWSLDAGPEPLRVFLSNLINHNSFPVPGEVVGLSFLPEVSTPERGAVLHTWFHSSSQMKPYLEVYWMDRKDANLKQTAFQWWEMRWLLCWKVFSQQKEKFFWLIDLLHTAALGTQNWRREEFGRTFCKMRSCPLVSYLPWCSWLFRASAFPNTWSLN